MDPIFATHALAWFTGALTVITGIALIGALFSLGRQGSYKD